MCCTSISRGRNLKWMYRFVIFLVFGLVLIGLFYILPFPCVTSTSTDALVCRFQGYVIIIMPVIGLVAFRFLIPLVYRLFLKDYLARLFPMSCGHRRCIFTGKSSKTLVELLLTIDNELPIIHESQQITIVPFLEHIKNGFHRNVTPSISWKYFFVGSITERYGIPFTCNHDLLYLNGLKTDFDVMLCFDHEAMSASFSGRNGNILIEVVPLGYAQLMYMESRDVIKSNEVMKQAKRAVSFLKMRNLLRSAFLRILFSYLELLKYKRTGPAINISIRTVVDFDITPCIKCCEWPPHSDWPTRQRCWPSQEDVTRIVSHGCHLVAKPAPSDKEQTSWRFSFSVAEVELSKLVPNTARKCLLALKIILKDHMQPVVAGITSYYLKTIFLNTLEKTPVDFWVDENVEKCFFFLLNEFHGALVSGNGFHFWFRSVNLFEKLSDPKQVAVLIKKLERIAENPAPFIYDDGCCCLYPCCTRKRLYDSRERRLTNFDVHDEVICVERESEQECDNVDYRGSSRSSNTSLEFV